MMKLSQITDGAFVALITFAVCYSHAAYYSKMSALSAVVGLAAAAIAACVFLLVSEKKNSSALIKKKDEKDFADCKAALQIKGFTETAAIVRKLLTREDKKPVYENGGFSTCDGKFVYAKFRFEKVSADDVARAYRAAPTGYTTEFWGITFTDEAVKLAETSGEKIKLIYLADIFPLLKKHDIVPSGGISRTKEKNKFFTLLKKTFDRKKAKTFALYGFTLLALSYFAFFPVWYIVCGSVFLLYALAATFFSKRDQNSI